MSDKPKYASGPWTACQNGKCSCKQVWCPDFPIAQITAGKWGDDYPSIRFVDGESKGTIGAKVEAYMEQITYGEISEEMAVANARLIAAAPELLEACKMAHEYIGILENKLDRPETFMIAQFSPILAKLHTVITKAIDGEEHKSPLSALERVRDEF